MARALEAARALRGRTSPNPWVGAVLVRAGEVVSVGATSPPGGPHAEAAALAGAPAGLGGTLYTTLEPCAAFPGKRTPPCADAVIAAGIDRVVVAIEDPDPNVRGRGIAAMRDAGVQVEVGDGADEAARLLRPYIKHRQTGLPYVIAKFAASLDGRTATRTGDSKWITGEAARARVHEERDSVDAILVGSGTVLADDPALTARPGGRAASRQPLRIVADAHGRVPPTARLFAEPGPVLVATSAASSAGWRAEVAATGAQLLICEHDGRGINLHQLLEVLGQRGILSLWVEGGGTLLGSLLAGGHADEVRAFLAPVIIGGDGLPAIVGTGVATVADAWRLRDVTFEPLGEDILVSGYTGDWAP